MKIIKTIDEMRNQTAEWRRSGFSVGLVPTMGFLHDGHMSLVTVSIKANEKNILSIFVNPMQFGENEDLNKYPRNLDSDLSICSKNGIDVVFAPSVEEMYPHGFSSEVNVGSVADELTGESRPGHFSGVCTVVNKLFNITGADRAYFGQKDAQQLAIIKKMVHDLNMDIEIIGCPTIREKDGLAMSSRNSYLGKEDRLKAGSIYLALQHGQKAYHIGEKKPEKVKGIITEYLKAVPDISIDYIEIVDPDSMKPQTSIKKGDMCLISAGLGTTTLIDNIIFGIE